MQNQISLIMDQEKIATYNTPHGLFNIGYIEDKISCIKFAFGKSSPDMKNANTLTDIAYSQLLEYFEGKRKLFDLPLIMIGTDFRKKVWQALCDIPYGQTRSYKQIAEAIGNPKASRAVGLANNKNPIAIVVPCHRVIGSNGKLVGYAGGLDLKQNLLKMEQENI